MTPTGPLQHYNNNVQPVRSKINSKELQEILLVAIGQTSQGGWNNFWGSAPW
jgi:hypothetical protein